MHKRTILLTAFLLLLAGSKPIVGQQPGKVANQRVPVLVELFTSEGCSDCPPADSLLAKLDRAQPIPGAEVIALSEHVDYWNRLGWADPYSSAFYSQRQRDYSDRFGLNSAYTPQMVVDGSNEFVGSDERRAHSAIAEAASKDKTEIHISDLRVEGDYFRFRLQADAPRNKAAEAYVVLADNSDTSQVARGENSGRTLSHVAVARVFSPAEHIAKNAALDKEFRMNAHSLNRNNLRLVAFLQESNHGRVLAAVMKDLSGLQ